ncbi:MAG: hypothetical protein ACREX9_08325, partial [Gammaproteobacteria bacterium]
AYTDFDDILDLAERTNDELNRCAARTGTNNEACLYCGGTALLNLCGEGLLMILHPIPSGFDAFPRTPRRP